MGICSELLKRIGNTPLLPLKTLWKDLPPGVQIWAKAEYFNPSGSVKDRAARSMILDGIERKKLTEGKIILDATSGNTGIAYAMIGSALGYEVHLCLPANANVERKRILQAYGAKIIETDPLSGSDGAMIHARKLAAEFPDRYFYPDQYGNPANVRAHYEGTGVEIWNQTGGRVSHFVAGMGTSGTFVGTSRRLKRFKPTIETIAMQPDSPLHGLEGMKHMETTINPEIYDPSAADRFVEISTESALLYVNQLARHEGIFIGPSSGGNIAAAVKVAHEAKPGSVIVTVLCDTGTRYLTEMFTHGGGI